jgi:hypothetical protein
MLDYYAAPAPMTDLSHHRDAIEGLEPDPRALAEVVRGVLVHRDWAPLMGLEFGADRLADQHVRRIGEVIDRINALQPDPLNVRREPRDRMVGVCRHFAVMHVALLRHFGIPARARCGFGAYFGPGFNDHWITEWWDGGRWVRHDAQIGSQARAMLALDFDPADQPPDKFLTGAEAWRMCRAGEADPNEFGIFDLRGLWFVVGDLLLDLAALNKVELLPWDGLGGGPNWQRDDLDELDQLAESITHDEREEIQDAYRRHPVPSRIISWIDGVPTPVDLESLVLEVS